MFQLFDFILAAGGGVFLLSLFGRSGLSHVVPQPVETAHLDEQSAR
jgi:hypothetical protein